MSKATSLKLASHTKSQSPSTHSATHDVLISATSQIVSAYIVNRSHEATNLTQLMADVYHTLSSLAQADAKHAPATGSGSKNRTPSIAVEDSIKADYLVCLEDGKQVKMLKRYLKSNYNMTPEQYRARWDLPLNYPMVAPNYAKVRSNLAKQIGLGRRGLPHVAKRLSESRVSL